MKKEKSRSSVVFGENFLEETEVELTVVRLERDKKEIMNIECSEGDSSQTHFPVFPKSRAFSAMTNR